MKRPVVTLAVLLVVGAALLGFLAWRAQRPPSGGASARPSSPEGAAGTRAPATSPAGASDPQAARTRAQLLAALDDARQKRLAPAAAPTGGLGGVPADEAGPTLDATYLRERIRELSPLWRECYDHALRDNPTLDGRMVVELVLAGEPAVGGVVESTRILEGASARDSGLEECVRESAYALQFQPPSGGGRVTVHLPLVFARADAGAR